MFKNLQEGPVLLEQSESEGKGWDTGTGGGRGADCMGPYRIFVKILAFFSVRWSY